VRLPTSPPTSHAAKLFLLHSNFLPVNIRSPPVLLLGCYGPDKTGVLRPSDQHRTSILLTRKIAKTNHFLFIILVLTFSSRRLQFPVLKRPQSPLKKFQSLYRYSDTSVIQINKKSINLQLWKLSSPSVSIISLHTILAKFAKVSVKLKVSSLKFASPLPNLRNLSLKLPPRNVAAYSNQTVNHHPRKHLRNSAPTLLSANFSSYKMGSNGMLR